MTGLEIVRVGIDTGEWIVDERRETEEEEKKEVEIPS